LQFISGIGDSCGEWDDYFDSDGIDDDVDADGGVYGDGDGSLRRPDPYGDLYLECGSGAGLYDECGDGCGDDDGGEYDGVYHYCYFGEQL
jgi:hypothetical protein